MTFDIPLKMISNSKCSWQTSQSHFSEHLLERENSEKKFCSKIPQCFLQQLHQRHLVAILDKPARLIISLLFGFVSDSVSIMLKNKKILRQQYAIQAIQPLLFAALASTPPNKLVSLCKFQLLLFPETMSKFATAVKSTEIFAFEGGRIKLLISSHLSA